MPIPALRHSLLCVAVFAALLLGPGLLSAQEQITPPSQGGPYINAPLPAPVGHRQPRVGDVPVTDKTAAELAEERQQADLNRRLRICRGC
jgi:hypothetical protein